MKTPSLSIHALALALAPPLALAVGCTNTSDSGDATLSVAVTDAPSDELESFEVDFASIELFEEDGGTVDVLSSPVRVDLTTLADASQLLNVLAVPPGTYVRARVTLDFQQASAMLTGQTAPAAVLDADGLPLTGQRVLDVSLGALLRPSSGTHRLLELEFDLNQSVQVDTVGNQVLVEPALIPRVDPPQPKELLIAGGLLDVTPDFQTGSFGLEIQTLAQVPLGTVRIAVTPTTVFQVDGVPLIGAAGLTALAGRPLGSWVQLAASLSVGPVGLTATYVEAGTGTYNGGTDIVEGHVIGRVGGPGANATLMVLGYGENAAHTAFQFNTTFTVDVSFANTRVVRRGASTALDTDALNVGQRVRIFGSLGGTVMNATATDAVVRPQPTRVLGFANGPIAGGTLSVDVARIGLRDQAVFNWNEGGATPPNPMALVADTGGSNPGGIAASTAVELIGHFPPIDDATEDFDASIVINRDLAPSLWLLFDRPFGLSVTTLPSPTEITFQLSGAPVLGELAVVDRGFVGVQAIPFTPDPVVRPKGPLGLYLLRDRQTGALQLFLEFEDFASSLAQFQGLGADVFNFSAIGDWDATTNALSAGIVLAVVD